MKSILLIPIVLLLSCIHNRYKENVKDTLYVQQPILFDSVTENGSILTIGINGSTTMFYQTDSTKIWFQQYLKLKRKGVPDSLNKYYLKLMKK